LLIIYIAIRIACLYPPILQNFGNDHINLNIKTKRAMIIKDTHIFIYNFFVFLHRTAKGLSCTLLPKSDRLGAESKKPGGLQQKPTATYGAETQRVT